MIGKELSDFDDIFIKSNDLTHLQGPTVIALAHNEMYFLPSWLKHYRNLGAERFIILDDASDDHTLDYLTAQPDVMVVGSNYRFGDTVPVVVRAGLNSQTIEKHQMKLLWRMILSDKFTLDRWAVQADLDEFLILPRESSLRSIFEELDHLEFDAVTTTMLDVYPPDIMGLQAQMSQNTVKFEDDWYFDARAHRLPKKGKLKQVYAGSRARLHHQFLIKQRLSLLARARAETQRGLSALRGKGPYKNINSTRKYSLVRWRRNTWMRSAHDVDLAISPSHHLPIVHMKFTGDLYRRAQVAIRDKSYYKGSSEYVLLVELLAEMEQQNASFLCRSSASVHDLDKYHETKLILGFR
jgi:hypothetical protein